MLGANSLSSSTASITLTETVEESKPKTLILKLKNKSPQVTWSQETINNEFMRKKSSKRCCIFHKTKKFGESDSDESDSDMDELGNDEITSSKKDPQQRKLENMQRFHA